MSDTGETHRARGPLQTALGAMAAGSRAAAGIALERDRTDRLRRLAEVTADRVRQRRRPSRPTMRALVVRRGATLRWHDLPSPPEPDSSGLGEQGAVVAPLAMATCDLDRPLGLGATPFPLPVHLGHECVAEVLSVGSAVRIVRCGDRVVVPFQISCGVCSACRLKQTGNCRMVPPLSMYGFGVVGGLWGGVLAEQVAVPYADAMLVPLPVGVDPVAVASAGDTLTDAYRHVAPYVNHVRQHPDGPRVIVVGAVNRRTDFGGSVPLYAGLVVRAMLPEADLLLVDARPAVRRHAERLGLPAVLPSQLGRQSAPLVIDSSADPRGLALALRAAAPDGVCSCAGSLHGSVRVPAARMFGRNVTLSIARSHVRSAIPGLLDLVVRGQLRPELVTTTCASFDDAPTVLRDYLLGDDVKTVLVRRDGPLRV